MTLEKLIADRDLRHRLYQLETTLRALIDADTPEKAREAIAEARRLIYPDEPDDTAAAGANESAETQPAETPDPGVTAVPDTEPPTKRCSRCGETKPVDAYAPHRTRHDGLQSYCRPCMREYRKQRRAANSKAAAKPADQKPAQQPAKKTAPPESAQGPAPTPTPNSKSLPSDGDLAPPGGPRAQITITCPTHGELARHIDPAPPGGITREMRAAYAGIEKQLHDHCDSPLRVDVADAPEPRGRPIDPDLEATT